MPLKLAMFIIDIMCWRNVVLAFARRLHQCHFRISWNSSMMPFLLWLCPEEKKASLSGKTCLYKRLLLRRASVKVSGIVDVALYSKSYLTSIQVSGQYIDSECARLCKEIKLCSCWCSRFCFCVCFSACFTVLAGSLPRSSLLKMSNCLLVSGS